MSAEETPAALAHVLPGVRTDDDGDARQRVERAYESARGDVYRVALRLGGGQRAFAEDVTQDVFVQLLGAIRGLDDRDALGGWLYRVTVNASLGRLRRDRLRRSVLEWLGRAQPSSAEPERAWEARSELARVLETIESLPPKERVVLILLHLEERSQAEIAAILGHSKGYVSKLVDRAHLRIRARGWEVRDG